MIHTSKIHSQTQFVLLPKCSTLLKFVADTN